MHDCAPLATGVLASATVLPVYLDCHATTPLCPEAVEAEARAGVCANANSKHGWGTMGREVIETARREFADVFFRCDPACIVFNSGATEGNAFAIRGVLDAFALRGIARRHVVATAIEHSSVLGVLEREVAKGRCEVTLVPVGPSGIVDPGAVAAAIRPDTALVTVMQAQNEVGTLQHLAEIARLCREREVLLHSDASQSFGRMAPPEADLVTVSGHKFYGPKGVGAVYVAPALIGWIEPQFYGGMAASGMRAGTANVAGIAGMAAALRMIRGAWPGAAGRIRCLRDTLLGGLLAIGEGRVRVNGDITERMPHNLNVSLAGVDAEALHRMLAPEIAVSGAAACKTLGVDRSHVLEAMGLRDGAPVRFGLGLATTQADINVAIRAVARASDALYGRPAGGVYSLRDAPVLAPAYGGPPPPPTAREAELVASYGAPAAFLEASGRGPRL